MSRRNALLFSTALALAAMWMLIQRSEGIPDQGRDAIDTSVLKKTPSETRAILDQKADALDDDHIAVDWQSRLIVPAKLEHRDSHRINMDMPFTSRYEDLVNRSNSGDPGAATDLAASLSYCAAAPRNIEQQERLIDHTNQTRRVEGYVYPVDNLDEAIRQIVRRYEFCDGITREQILDNYLYAKIAADNGSLQAKAGSLRYGKGMLYEDIWPALERAWSSEEERWQHSVRHTADAAEAGNVSAIYELGRIFESDVSFSSGTHLNQAEAAAYRIAGAHLKILSGSDSQLYRPIMEKAINSVAAHDVEAAIALANELVERDGCCFTYRSPAQLDNVK